MTKNALKYKFRNSLDLDKYIIGFEERTKVYISKKTLLFVVAWNIYSNNFLIKPTQTRHIV